jgi:hypothetical protein
MARKPRMQVTVALANKRRTSPGHCSPRENSSSSGCRGREPLRARQVAASADRNPHRLDADVFPGGCGDDSEVVKGAASWGGHVNESANLHEVNYGRLLNRPFRR